MRDNGVIVLMPGEDAEFAMKRLKKLLIRNGTLSAMQRHEEYRKPSEAARIKSAKARRKAWKAAKRIAEFDYESPGTKRAAPRQRHVRRVAPLAVATPAALPSPQRRDEPLRLPLREAYAAARRESIEQASS